MSVTWMHLCSSRSPESNVIAQDVPFTQKIFSSILHVNDMSFISPDNETNKENILYTKKDIKQKLIRRNKEKYY